MAYDDDDELTRLKMGRVHGDTEEELWRRVFSRSRPIPHLAPGKKPQSRSSSHLTGEPLRHRGGIIAGERSSGVGREAVFKVVGRTKSARVAWNMLRYVARQRDVDRQKADAPVIELFDEYGRTVDRDRLAEALDGWDLMPDADNLSKRARQLAKEGKASEVRTLPLCKRLHNIQVWHFVASIIGDEKDTEILSRLRRAADLTVDELFAAEGRRALWCLHADTPGHPHVHILVRSASAIDGRRLHLDRPGDTLHAMRETFAAHLRAEGLSFGATRREDRPRLRREIMRGRAPLRTGKSMAEVKNRLAGLADVVPGWMAPEPSPTGLSAAWQARQWRKLKDDLTHEEKLLVAMFDRLYVAPQPAMECWRSFLWQSAHRNRDQQIACPNLRLAVWYIRHRPDEFGEVRPNAEAPDRKELVDILRRLNHVPALRTPCEFGVPSQARWEKRVKRDRQGVVHSLTRVAEALDRETLNEHLPQAVRRAIEQALREPVDQQMPPARDSRRTTPTVSPWESTTPTSTPSAPAAAQHNPEPTHQAEFPVQESRRWNPPQPRPVRHIEYDR